MKKDAPLVYEIYWEVLCHFQICTETTGLRAGGIKHMAWANYLFKGLGDKVGRVSHLAPSTDAEFKERIDASMSLYITESKPYTVFESFHHQAKTPISNRALLAEFLMLWLKRCVMLILPHEAIITYMVYPAVMLAIS